MADARTVVLTLLAARMPGTICPSEVARTMAGSGAGPEPWRDAMPAVHAAVDDLVAAGRVRLSWKGKALARRSGPYRIGSSDADVRHKR